MRLRNRKAEYEIMGEPVKRRRLHSLRFWLILFSAATLITLAFIFSNSFQSGDESNARSSVIAEFLQSLIDPDGKIPENVFNAVIRKLAHFFEFSLLGAASALWLWLWRSENGVRSVRRVNFSSAMLFCLLAANVDEFIQSFGSRTSSVKDVFIDFSGSLFGIGVMCLALAVIGGIRGQKKPKKTD